MPEEAKRNRNPIILICAAVAVVVLIAVVVVLSLSNKKIDDNYFVDDNTKYVLTLDSDQILGLDSGEYAPEKTHTVFYYSNNEVTSLKLFYAYENEDTAKKAYEYIKGANEGGFTEIKLEGKYIAITTDEALYKGMTVDDVKQQIEFMEMLQKINSGETVEDEETKEEVKEETVEEEAVEEETVEEEEYNLIKKLAFKASFFILALFLKSFYRRFNNLLC